VFGWATEEQLQPNVDGLSRDEVLLSSLLTTAAVVLMMRYLARRETENGTSSGMSSAGATEDATPDLADEVRDASANPPRSENHSDSLWRQVA
jgi:hypothetical protein